MSNPEGNDSKPEPPAEGDPKMRRMVSRRGLLTGELKDAGVQVARSLPGLGSIFGLVTRERPGERDERLARRLWRLLLGRDPKTEESAAGLDLIRKAETLDEKGDALIDILWALCQTQEFADRQLPNDVLIRGLYRIALDRAPTDSEQDAALGIMAEATESDAKPAALEGLFAALIRSWESVLRKTP